MQKKAKCIAFSSHKGGTGKTTSCVSIAGFLAKGGHKTLVVIVDTGIENLHLAPAEFDLSAAEILLVSNSFALSRILEELQPLYDFILIDLPTCSGIKPEELGKLFMPFSQLESSYDKKYEGTGLGLALARNMVELFGGSVFVESEFGKGSRFAFVIPVKR